MGRADAIRERNRKVVVNDATGNEYTIRRLHPRDFMPVGLIAMIVNEDIKEVEDIDKYVNDPAREEEILAVERVVLGSGVVDPQITWDPHDADTEKVYVLDITADKDFLIDNIAQLSGFSKDILDVVDKFRRGQQPGTGLDGQVLPRVAAPTDGPGDSGLPASGEVLEGLREGAGQAGKASGGQGPA